MGRSKRDNRHDMTGYGSISRNRIASGIKQLGDHMKRRIGFVPDWPTVSELIESQMTPQMRAVQTTLRDAPWLASPCLTRVISLQMFAEGTRVRISTGAVYLKDWPLGLQLYNCDMGSADGQTTLGNHFKGQLNDVRVLAEQSRLVTELGHYVLLYSNGPAHFAGTWPRLARTIADREMDGSEEFKGMRTVERNRIDHNWLAAFERCDRWIAEWMAMSMAGDANERELNVELNACEKDPEVTKYIAALVEVPIWL